MNAESRRKKLKALSVKLDGPDILPRMDNNGTRISALLGYLKSLARLNKGLKAYLTEFPDKELPELVNTDWQSMVEFLAVFAISLSAEHKASAS